MLKPQDVMIALKLVTMTGREWKYSEAALELCMSPSEVHSGVKRLKRCGLVTELSISLDTTEMKQHLPETANIKEFLRHGVRFVFPLALGEPVLGIPTSYGVTHLFEGFSHRFPYTPVWELPGGEYAGSSVKPLYASAPKAAVRDFRLYELLALTDALRTDDAPLRDFAFEKINLLLGE